MSGIRHCRVKLPPVALTTPGRRLVSKYPVSFEPNAQHVHEVNCYISGGPSAENFSDLSREKREQAKSAIKSAVREEKELKFNRLAVKDNIAVQGLPTTCASRILRGHEIPFTATVVKQWETYNAAIVRGKTNMDEFGMGSHSTASAYGPVSNVHPLEGRSPGGSSGGSAAAVRIRDSKDALGTDTGGSIRIPAAYTCTYGFKPSYGMLSRWGVVPYANSLDTVGIIARQLERITKMIQNLYHKHDPNDPTSLPNSVRERGIGLQSHPKNGRLDGFTFGVPIEYNIEELDSRIRTGWTQALEKIQELGGRVVPISLPSTKHALSAYYIIAPAEAASNLSKYDGIRYGKRDDGTASDAVDGVLYANTRGAGFGAEVKRRILLGSYTLSSEAMNNHFIQAQKVRQLVRRDFDRVFVLSNPLKDEEVFDLSDMDGSVVLENKLGPSQVDFVVCPTAPTPPPSLEDVAKQTPLDAYMNDVFTVPASLAGLPALSMPMDIPRVPALGTADMGFGGLQLIGQFWDDARLLAVAGHLAPVISTETFMAQSRFHKHLAGE
ncbi:amidase signature domain-containing protein [Pseudomassariella vexata]|uniref:Glutamyl-tRNA(Gln) amidotransferase subunit A, mitochondrial n=1 Tax=Pseudomassariella vexata TaxID=1141098 RepID=A0A1Y2E783_9PEZI|nr:amidase signature domain-containing protein [Pseudomassariella vexata]ORY67411.1 amidase signature domain-containing protein [Pseudomassariella vexata]